MGLSRLQISHVRNLTDVTLSDLPRLNQFVGANGSGKTSLIEAVYLLGRAKTLRSNQIRPVIQRGEQSLTVFGINETGSALGVERSTATTRIRIDQQDVRSRSELVSRLPLLLITPESHRLFELGPKLRRQFLDWAMFHVEPAFHGVWQTYQKALKQRNALLRSLAGDTQLQPWEDLMVESGEALSELRDVVVRQLDPMMGRVTAELLELDPPELRYLPGWDQKQSLGEALLQGRDRDRARGYTGVGPHRADLAIQLADQPARDVVSRGQQKLLIAALCLAQAGLFANKRGQRSMLLVDDLAAELDAERRKAFFSVLTRYPGQVFITGTVAMTDIDPEWKLFHVEHGDIAAI